MERESEESANNLLIRLQLFHDWILFAKQQLQFVGADQGERSFSDLLQKEQGLKVGTIYKIFRVSEFISDRFMIYSITTFNFELSNSKQDSTNIVLDYNVWYLFFALYILESKFKKERDHIWSAVP